MRTQETAPSVTFLNFSGDITLTWDKTNEAAMLALVEKKMKEGYTFFILKPRALSAFGTKKVVATSIDEIKAAGSVSVPDALAKKVMLNLGDADVSSVVEAGKASILSTVKDASMETLSRAKTAVEVVTRQTVAVRPLQGG